MANRAGQQVGNYKLLKLLGEGGFAEVYLAEHIVLKQMKAIKVLRTILSEQEGVSFRTEAQRLAQLTHPHIISILDFDEREGIPYLVMEYAPNGSLRDRHPKGTSVPLLTIVDYVKQIASALQYIHDQKLIHRDVKPENMLFGQDNKILLGDVGIAVVAHSEYSQRTQLATGTPYYMAPEQFRGKAEPASDQYSLGVIVYEWISGRPPFSEGDSLQLGFQHAFEPPPPLRVVAPTVSIDVEKVVMVALNKQPQERFKSILAFTIALEKASQTKSLVQPMSQQYSAIPPNQRVIRPQVDAPPAQAINKDALYREGVVARSKGDLERAASLWQQILDQDSHYGNDTLFPQMQKLREEMRQQVIPRIKQQARDAEKAGAFEQEAELLKSLLRLSPKDRGAYKRLENYLLHQGQEARKRGDWSFEINVLTELRAFADPNVFIILGQIDYAIRDATNNLRYAWMYENAIQLVKEGNYDAAKRLLQDLWKQAPEYGDPAQLAKSIGIRVPSRFLVKYIR